MFAFYAVDVWNRVGAGWYLAMHILSLLIDMAGLERKEMASKHSGYGWCGVGVPCNVMWYTQGSVMKSEDL